MNFAAALLGVMCAIRRVVCRGASWTHRSGTIAMAILTGALLIYVFISAMNAAANYLPQEWRLQERPHLAWLPHSYDADSTWQVLRNFAALAAMFWATHDWLASAPRASDGRPRASARLRLLISVMTINAAVLALEGFIQRTSGTPNLLWIEPTHMNKDASAQFGPFAYRSNAAQYLNLIWPVALGFWWWLQRDALQSNRRGRHHSLLPCVLAIAAACPYSLSRAAAGVTAALLIGCCVVFITKRSVPRAIRLAATTLTIGTLAAGLFLAWSPLSKRFADTAQNPLAGREETYQLAQQMARDYPWFGTGPGTFTHLFQVYRQNPEQYWPAQLHNDWLEFRITFGWTGLSLMLAALALASLRWLGPGGVPADATFLTLAAMALVGCLAHATVDFPFQIYSIQFMFLVIAATLFSSSRIRRRPRADSAS